MKHSALPTVARALIACLALAVISCASAPNVGVRPAFKKKQVPRIAVAPFYALGNFSLSGEELEAVLEASEQAAIDKLRAEGFEVVEPPAFRQHLAEHGVADQFDDGVLLRSSLSQYFEPNDESVAGDALEVETIKQLYAAGQLPAEALLFGEVVYHTQTRCRVDPTEFNEQADVEPSSATGEAESPCVVSHFQAKLVHAPSGETMWFNQKLLQTHTGEVAEQQDRQNVVHTVTRTLGGNHGVASFRGTSAGPKESDQASLKNDEE